MTEQNNTTPKSMTEQNNTQVVMTNQNHAIPNPTTTAKPTTLLTTESEQQTMTTMTTRTTTTESLSSSIITNPPPTTSSTLSTLQSTIQNITIQSECSLTLSSMLADIEQSHTLSTALHHHTISSTLSSRARRAERNLDEMMALYRRDYEMRIELADRFVGELSVLSQRMGELERWKERNEEKVRGYEGMRERVDRVEEELRSLKRGRSLDVKKRGDDGEDDGDLVKIEEEEEEKEKGLNDGKEIENENNKDEKITLSLNSKEGSTNRAQINVEDEIRAAADAGLLTPEEVEAYAVALSESKESSVDGTTSGANGENVLPSSSSSSGPMNNSNVSPLEDIPSLETLPDAALMSVFGFMDAHDILGTSLVSVVMYSRVDTLFGLGGESVEKDASGDVGAAISDDGKTAALSSASASVVEDIEEEQQRGKATMISIPPAPKLETENKNIDSAAAAPTPAPAPAPSINPLQNMFSRLQAKPQQDDVSNIAAAATTGDGKTGAAASPSKVEDIEDEHTKAATASIPPTQQLETENKKIEAAASINPLQNMFSRLQSKPQPTTQPEDDLVSSITNNKKPFDSSSIPTTKTPPPPTTSSEHALNSAMASTIASKLSSTELSVIFNMTKKLKEKDSYIHSLHHQITNLNSQIDDLNSRLDGTESVKEYLISKIKDVEQARQHTIEEMKRMTQQVSSDQEVIAFLDGRVQELERDVREGRNKVEEMGGVMERNRISGERRAQVLSDMLQFEREQMVESERGWKATKKVLVREVKHCRAQIATLKAERDSFDEQNVRLKDALLSLNGGGGNGGGGSSPLD